MTVACRHSRRRHHYQRPTMAPLMMSVDGTQGMIGSLGFGISQCRVKICPEIQRQGLDI